MSRNPLQGGPYRCEDCGKTFPTARELREHEDLCEGQQAGVGIGRAGRDEEG